MANCKIMNIPFNSNLTYEDEKELEYLRQVESELEAWEELKKHKTTIFAWVPFKSEEREIFKKALEIK